MVKLNTRVFSDCDAIRANRIREKPEYRLLVCAPGGFRTAEKEPTKCPLHAQAKCLCSTAVR